MPPPARHLIAPTFVCKKPLRQNRSGSFCFFYASPGRGKVTVTVVPVPRVLSSATRAW